MRVIPGRGCVCGVVGRDVLGSAGPGADCSRVRGTTWKGRPERVRVPYLKTLRRGDLCTQVAAGP